MAFKKGYRKRAKKPSMMRQAGSVLSTATKALALAKYVKSLVNVERKYIDLTSIIRPNTTGAVATVTAIAQGSDYNQRTGLSIKATSLQLRWNCTFSSTSTASYCRCILFYDTENNGGSPAVTDVLEFVNTTSAINHINTQRFKIMYDKVVTVNAAIASTHQEHFEKMEHHIKYQGPTAAGADYDKGQMFILFISNEVIADAPFVEFNTRVRYIDN